MSKDKKISKDNVSKNNKNLIGNSGEFFVAAELSRRGLTANVLLGNSEAVDILALNVNSNNNYSIQVKTISNKQKHWPLNKKNEKLIKNNLYYVFVRIIDFNNPEFYIVPSKKVANEITNSHKKWLGGDGKNSKTHKDNTMRVFTPDEKYKNKWDCFR